MVRNIFGDHRSCANEGVSSNGVAADDGGIGTQGGAVLDQSGTDLIHFSNFGPGIIDIGKDHRRATEDTILQGHPRKNRNIILYLAFIPSGHLRADDHVLADIAILADFGTGEDGGEIPDLTTSAYHNIFVNNR